MSGSLQGVARGLYLTQAAVNAQGMIAEWTAMDFLMLEEQVAAAIGVSVASLPDSPRALALFCLKEAEKALEESMPVRNMAGVLVEPDTREPLTDKQAAIFEFIKGRIDGDKIPPSTREIGAAFGIKSTNGVNDHVHALVRKGWLTRDPTKVRSIRIV